MRRTTPTVCLLAVALTAGSALAASLGEIVVTATKTERTLEDAPGAVTVITREELEARDIHTLDKALAWVAGAFAKRSKGLADATPSVTLRGFESQKRTLVLLDGVPVNDGYSSGVEWAALPVENVERIEVLRGPASALYGGGAMGGVIHVITRTPDRWRAWASAGAGTDDLRSFRAGAGGTLTRDLPTLGLQVGFERESTQGYHSVPVLRSPTTKAADFGVTGGEATTDPTGEKTKYRVGWKGENGARRQSVDGKLRWAYGDRSSVTLAGWEGFHEYWYGDPKSDLRDADGAPVFGAADGGSANVALPSGDVVTVKPSYFLSGPGKDTNRIVALTWDHRGDALGVWAQISRNTGESWWVSVGSGAGFDGGPGKRNDTDTESVGGELRFEVPAGPSHVLTVGGTLRRDTMDVDTYTLDDWTDEGSKADQTYHAGGSARLWSVFGQDEWAVHPRLSLYLGVRYDAWSLRDGEAGTPGSEDEAPSRHDAAVSPRLYATWKARDTTVVKVGAGRAFRAPNLYELFRTWSFYSTTYQGNPDLDPETVWTFEAGVHQAFLDGRGRLGVTYFHNEIDDLIYRKLVSTDPKVKRTENAGQGRTDGVEVEAAAAWTPGVRTWANLTWTHAVITRNDADPSSEGRYVPGVPKWAASGGLDLERGPWAGSLALRYYGKIYDDADNSDTAEGVYQTYEPVWLADVRVAYRPASWVELSLSVDNLFETDYWAYYRAPGRTWFGELRVEY